MSIFRHRKRRQFNADEAMRLSRLEQLTRLSDILGHVDPAGSDSTQIAALAGTRGYPTTADRIMAIHRADFAAVDDVTLPEIDAIDWATAHLELSRAMDAYNRDVGDAPPAKVRDIRPQPDLSTPDGMRDFARVLPNIAKCVAHAQEIERQHATGLSDASR